MEQLHVRQLATKTLPASKPASSTCSTPLILNNPIHIKHRRAVCRKKRPSAWCERLFRLRGFTSCQKLIPVLYLCSLTFPEFSFPPLKLRVLRSGASCGFTTYLLSAESELSLSRAGGTRAGTSQGFSGSHTGPLLLGHSHSPGWPSLELL
ncbi:hypothetical protein WMY93_032806 [Mugilogobius chulae]|uniref:Uncharacterized protein n=1 Tax=Mugilogobius chulae TaxID=88201 RepID=A0AAW0MIN3_9GOBI